MKIRRMGKKQWLCLLLVFCVLCTVVIGLRRYRQQQQEKAEAIKLEQDKITKQAEDLNRRLTALDTQTLTLQDLDSVDLLQEEINAASQEVRDLLVDNWAILLYQAQVRLETLQAQNGTYRHSWGKTFSAEDITTLDALFASFPTHISVYLRMLDDGSTYMYEPLQYYYTASIAKAPYALYLSYLEDQGELTLTKTERELMSAMISRSDNEATLSLAANYPASGSAYQSFLAQIGFTDPTSSTITLGSSIAGDMNAMDAGHTMLALYMYFSSETERALALQDDFLNYDYLAPLLTTEYPMAKKYGLEMGANHDMAIVYADRPFILCILTEGDGEVYMHDPYQIMHQASGLIVSIVE